jgi:hypothetical protein
VVDVRLPPARLLYVVARDRTDLYEGILEELGHGPEVRILLDRRRGERRKGERRQEGGSGLPGRRHGADRRHRPDLDARLIQAGFFTVRLA